MSKLTYFFIFLSSYALLALVVHRLLDKRRIRKESEKLKQLASDKFKDPDAFLLPIENAFEYREALRVAELIEADSPLKMQARQRINEYEEKLRLIDFINQHNSNNGGRQS